MKSSAWLNNALIVSMCFFGSMAFGTGVEAAKKLDEVVAPVDGVLDLSEKEFFAMVELLKARRVSPNQKRAILDLLEPPATRAKRIRTGLEKIPEGEVKPIGTAHLSPIKPKSQGGPVGRRLRENAICALIAHEKGQSSLAPKHEDRIDFGNLYGVDVDIDDTNLDYGLIKVELWCARQILAQPELLNMVAYVGLAENMSHRFPGHFGDLKPVIEAAKSEPAALGSFPNRKERYFGELFSRGYDATMSSFVYNIPKTYLKVVEVIVGRQFGVLQKATSQLGDNEAWARAKKYYLSAKRKNAFADAGIEDLVEEREKAEFEKTLTAGK